MCCMGDLGDWERMGKGTLGEESSCEWEMGLWEEGELETNACTQRRIGTICLFHRLVLVLVLVLFRCVCV